MRELTNELEEVEVEGYHAWLLAGEAADSWPQVAGVVRLLPHFDAYLIGCHPRDRLVPDAWAKRVLTRGAIGNLPLLLVDGVAIGLWQQQRRGRRLEIQVEAFQPLSAQQQQDLEVTATRIGEMAQAEGIFSPRAVEARSHL